MPDHSLKKNEILDIFYYGLIDASKDYLDSCAGCVFRERTVDQAELLLNNMLTNENNWTLPKPIPEPIKPTPEPIPKPTPKKRGVLFLSPEDMQEAKKSMKEKVLNTTKKYTSVMIRVCHSRSRFLSCMYIHDKFMTESR